ncbi:hypothetical protein F5Y03DRAFT_393039 [Xylaria venustula]|nr:hypothetical protein F5Y03DRAFT_393039 [Xylaria venustula]
MNDYQFKVLGGILGLMLFSWASICIFLIYQFFKSVNRSEEDALLEFELVDRNITPQVEGTIALPIGRASIQSTDRTMTPSMDRTGDPPAYRAIDLMIPPRCVWHRHPAYKQFVNLDLAAEEQRLGHQGHLDLELGV